MKCAQSTKQCVRNMPRSHKQTKRSVKVACSDGVQQVCIWRLLRLHRYARWRVGFGLLGLALTIAISIARMLDRCGAGRALGSGSGAKHEAQQQSGERVLNSVQRQSPRFSDRRENPEGEKPQSSSNSDGQRGVHIGVQRHGGYGSEAAPVGIDRERRRRARRRRFFQKSGRRPSRRSGFIPTQIQLTAALCLASSCHSCVVVQVRQSSGLT